MRICLFADARSVHIQQLTRALCAEGHSIHIVTHKPALVPGATVERFQVPIAGLTHPHRWRRRLRDYLRQFVRSFDILNIQFLSDWGFRSEEDDWEDGCVVCSAWGSDVFDPPEETPAGAELLRIRRNMLQHAHAITACGLSFAHELAAFGGLSEDSISIAPFGVDCNLFHSQAKATHIQKMLRVGCFKGFRPVYGIPYFIRAMPLIAKHVPTAEFILVGAGCQLEECKKLAIDSGVADKVQWIGRQSHGSLPHILAEWDVSVMPSVHEAFGVAALESSAMQIPVVASTALGFRDTIQQGVTGALVSVQDTRALADCIVGLLQDGVERRRMGAEGRRWVQKTYDWQVVAPQWSSVFESARERTLTMI